MPHDARMGNHVAIYIDFDNILMSHYDDLHGRESFRADTRAQRNAPRTKQRLLQARIDVGALMEFASSVGTISISRAYADWSGSVNSTYAEDLQQRAIDLVQLFPLRGTKNGADIRLAIDAIDDINRFNDITHVVVVAGDSDYVALAQRCKRFGRTVIGIAAGQSAHKFWIAACDEFKYYSRLPGVRANKGPESVRPLAAEAVVELIPTPGSDYAALLSKAMTLALAGTEDDFVYAGALKNQMLRLDPTFDESAVQCKSFTALLQSMSDVVEVHRDGSNTQVRLVARTDPDPKGPTKEVSSSSDSHPSAEAANLRGRLSLPRHPSLGPRLEPAALQGIRLLCDLIGARPAMSVYNDLWAALVECGFEEHIARRAAHQITASGLPVLVRTESLDVVPNRELREKSDDDLLVAFRQWMADRARNLMHPEPVTATMVAAAFFGTAPSNDATAHYQSALSVPGYCDMVVALDPLPSPRTLWRFSAVLGTVPEHERIDSVETFATALTSVAGDDERLNMEEVGAYHRWLTAAELIDNNHGLCRAAELKDHEIAAAIVLTWRRHLEEKSLFDPDSWLWREAFARIVLVDRYRADWRQWLADLGSTEPVPRPTRGDESYLSA